MLYFDTAMIMMANTGMSAAGLKVNDLRQILKIEIEASNELQRKIDQFRYELLGGQRPPEKNISLMEIANKDMTKDLVRRIELIEGGHELTPIDREMLQALSARLAVCDEQAMRLAEIRDWERNLRKDEIQRRPPPPPGPPPGVIRPQPVELLPLGGRPRRPSTSPPAKVTEHLRPANSRDVRATSPGPILDRADSKVASPSRSKERRRDSLYLYSPSLQASRSSSSTMTGTPPLPSKTPPSPRVLGEPRRYEEPVEEMPYRRPSSQRASQPSPRSTDTERGSVAPITEVPSRLQSISQARQPSPRVSAIESSQTAALSSRSTATERGSTVPGIEMQQRRTSQAPLSPLSLSSSYNAPRRVTDTTPPPARSRSDNGLSRLGEEMPSTRRASTYRPPSYRQDSDERTPRHRDSIDRPSSHRQSSDEKFRKENDQDKASWPLLYRILDVDPRTDPAVFDQVAKMALARLSLKHDPVRHPTDPEAPVRWAAVVQAYDTLINPESRRFYDLHRRDSPEPSHFDFSRLSVNPR